MFAKSMTLSRADVERGFARDELDIVLQPQIDVGSGEVCAAEAFVRWAHPSFGLMTPQLFLPAIEQAGENARLLDVVVRRALEASRAFFDSGLTWRVSVNLGAPDLRAGFAASVIGGALRDFAAAPDSLVIEAPEHALIDADETVVETLRALAEMGCVLSLDSGASLPDETVEPFAGLFSEIKIGGAAILRFAEIARKVDGGRIARRLAVAERHGLRSVAVGVEDERTLNALVRLGFTAIQGALVARPAPLAEILSWDGAWAGEEPRAARRVERAARPRPTPVAAPAPVVAPQAEAAPKLVERIPPAAPVFTSDAAYDDDALDLDFDDDDEFVSHAAVEDDIDPSADVVADSEELMALENAAPLHAGMIVRPSRRAAAPMSFDEPASALPPEPKAPPAPEPVVEDMRFARPLSLRVKEERKPAGFMSRLARLLKR